MSIPRRLLHALRDLLFGASYLLAFGKVATIEIYLYKSLNLQTVRDWRSLALGFATPSSIHHARDDRLIKLKAVQIAFNESKSALLTNRQLKIVFFGNT